jgi:protein-S-isoprenylcysteine O-methyltransferase Ste14
MLLYIALGISAVFGLYILRETKRTYEGRRPLSKRLSIGWWILDVFHSSLIILSAFYATWPLPINETIALTGGAIILGIGTNMMFAGMIEFRSMKKISGLDTSRLITTGIYRWSRNPQFFGLFLQIIGISLMGRSGFSFLLTFAAIIFSHYYIIRIEEPYLERIFGEEYKSYKLRTPRYIGIPREK